LLATQGQRGQAKGKVILGSVMGDVHSLGKNIVATMLQTAGFEVVDLGIDVPAVRFVEEAEKAGADIIALSALMTTTLQQMEVTLNRLRDAGVKVFTLVGGAVVSQEYADSIGADVYARDALEAVAKVKALFETGPGD
jgi:5-methyltetrahydrofolate--homocysteine methyltransferase